MVRDFDEQMEKGKKEGKRSMARTERHSRLQVKKKYREDNTDEAQWAPQRFISGTSRCCRRRRSGTARGTVEEEECGKAR